MALEKGDIRFIFKTLAQDTNNKGTVLREVEEVYINKAAGYVKVKQRDKSPLNMPIGEIQWFHCCLDLSGYNDGLQNDTKRTTSIEQQSSQR
jgi:hypothetical protein